jgi:hypothetical protein
VGLTHTSTRLRVFSVAVKFHEELFRVWLRARRDEWTAFKRDEGSMMTFSEYLAARATYLKEINNG